MNILQYKDYEGTAELDMDRGLCRGKILFISDLIIYEAATPLELQHAFEHAVDDYIETCQELGIEPKKPLKGQFNVRISPELHRAASIVAIKQGISLNEVVARSISSFVSPNIDINHNVKVTLSLNKEAVETMAVNTAMEKTEWRNISNAQH
jgi:predicted HicB family RNase H-like nuclease